MFERARPPQFLFVQISVADAAYAKKKLQNEAGTAQTLEKKSLTTMAIQLENILEDIAKERVLHLKNAGATEHSRRNKLTVHESRYIFIV